jgi:uncharacterized membrane protein YkvA (DUF1232 family)
MEVPRTLLIIVLFTALAWLLLVAVLWLHRPTRDQVGPVVHLVPDIARLVRSLLADSAVPRGPKIALGGLLVYLVSPLALVPDILPVVGALDDVIIGGLVLRWVGRRIGSRIYGPTGPAARRGSPFSVVCSGSKPAPPRREMRLTLRQRVALFAPLMFLLAVGLVGPAVLGLLATLTTYAPGETAIRWSGLDNYAAVFRDPEFVAATQNIVVFTVLAVPLELIIGFSLAWLLRRPRWHRSLLRVLLLLPWLVSPIASGVMWHFLRDTGQGLLQFVAAVFGLADVPSPLGQHGLALLTTVAIEVWRIAPLVAFLLLPGLTAISSENRSTRLSRARPRSRRSPYRTA